MLHLVEGTEITAEDPAGPISDSGLKEPSKIVLVVPWIIPSTRLLQLLLGSK